MMVIAWEKKVLLLLPQLSKVVIFLEEKKKESVTIPVGLTKVSTDYTLIRHKNKN